MPVFVDQTGRNIELKSRPRRIVSLVPSQTELLYDLGLKEEVVGITKFCIHPKEWFNTKTRIGGTKNCNIEKIKSLQPDLIIANKEENTKADIEALQQFAPVWISDIYNLSDALQMIEAIGEITQKITEAQNIVQTIANSFGNLMQCISSQTKQPCLYLIWKNPYMAAGQHTFINDMLQRCGFANVLSPESRYPEVDIQSFQDINGLNVLLSSEPYPFKEKEIELLKTKLPLANIQLVDGEMFSWYGSRLKYSATYFKTLKA